MDSTRLEEVLRRVEGSLDEKEASRVRAVFESYAYVSDLVEDKNTSIQRPRQLFFGSRTEKTDAVVGRKTKKPKTGLTAADGNTDESDATARRLIGATRGLRFHTRRSPRATRVPPAVRALSTRRRRACWCGSPGSRR